uniref:Succinate:cytochrome c oxidoreductase subunit 4 n=1 Tax=Compsopogon caeruleus TaxID=31354 RepID=A0A1Z1XBL3_9RHOD|nr:succinate:cytochrome c oxidoreductase subunit 4 [Compsopogon caeruleus]ARX96197.1 succinate:cytochrome c oxidoreductase subunit 4 [Compsopogon caeruleus]
MLLKFVLFLNANKFILIIDKLYIALTLILFPFFFMNILFKLHAFFILHASSGIENTIIDYVHHNSIRLYIVYTFKLFIVVFMNYNLIYYL